MEEAYELGTYLPVSFKSPKEQEYIAFLWDAFDTNYAHGNYQFAFLAYHMLTMSFVYFNPSCSFLWEEYFNIKVIHQLRRRSAEGLRAVRSWARISTSG